MPHDAQVQHLHERLVAETGAESIFTLRTNVSVPKALGSSSYVQRQRWFTIVDPDAELIVRAQTFVAALASVPFVSARLDQAILATGAPITAFFGKVVPPVQVTAQHEDDQPVKPKTKRTTKMPIKTRVDHAQRLLRDAIRALSWSFRLKQDRALQEWYARNVCRRFDELRAAEKAERPNQKAVLGQGEEPQPPGHEP
jgi:hypothetical protein